MVSCVCPPRSTGDTREPSLAHSSGHVGTSVDTFSDMFHVRKPASRDTFGHVGVYVRTEEEHIQTPKWLHTFHLKEFVCRLLTSQV
jgi:hypothetical protein